MEDVLTVFKASQYCNVSPKTIINWIESGHIKAYKTVGGHPHQQNRPGNLYEEPGHPHSGKRTQGIKYKRTVLFSKYFPSTSFAVKASLFLSFNTATSIPKLTMLNITVPRKSRLGATKYVTLKVMGKAISPMSPDILPRSSETVVSQKCMRNPKSPRLRNTPIAKRSPIFRISMGTKKSKAVDNMVSIVLL